MSQETAETILAFWQEAGPERWFKKDEAFDTALKARFAGLWGEAAAGLHDGWQATAEGALALSIVLDQFPRNMFRGSALAFSTDAAARRIAATAIARGHDRQVDPALRRFFYLPYMHAEDLDWQIRGVALYALAGDADGVHWADIHADIIRRFGRFPHRNTVLGRVTTPEEAAFLAAGGFSG